MSLRALVIAVGALTVVVIFAAGLAAGRVWERATVAEAVQSEHLYQLRTLEEDLTALQHRLEHHAEAQRRLADTALDCRVATEARHAGKRLALAMDRAAP